MSTVLSDADRVGLARALALAGGVQGATAPNPAVGCVITDASGEVVGEGATRPPGGPHAEVVALAAAGSRAAGGTAYVTLEPCDHHGRTPPCSSALLAAGVARVVVAHPDPHELAAGGTQRLRAGGVRVDVVTGTWRAAAAAHLEGFLHRLRHDRPHVTLKLAQTADGRTVPPGPSRWITGPGARRAVHRWRREVDGVLVGSGTVVADDPGLDVRDVPLGPRPQPRPIVFDARLRTPPEARVVGRGALVVTAAGASETDRQALRRAGAEVVAVAAGDGGGVDLRAALATVAAHGVDRVLAEPGLGLAAALLRDHLVDRLVRHVAPALGDGPPALAAPVPDPEAWRLERVGGAGPDLVLQHVRDPEVR